MTLILTEYVPVELPWDALSPEAVDLLCERYGDKVTLDRLFRPEDRWRLTSNGWVGFIPLPPDTGLSLRPKTPIANLFRMLEYAYTKTAFDPLDGTYGAATLEEFYDRLARKLAELVLRRGRAGFSRRYEPESDRLVFVRGRLDVVRSIRAPWDTQTLCHYEEHTADTEDNRILAWTLFVVARSGLCTDRTLPSVRHAYRQLASLVRVEPVPARLCSGRRYDRLNDDYRPMHALCRFFLENSGPSHDAGPRTMLPFLVDMAKLFETFVANWLEQHVPPELDVKAQQPKELSREAGLSVLYDLVVFDRARRTPVAVLDTKYKVAGTVANADFYQIFSYAKSLGCSLAYLVYPTALDRPLDLVIDGVRIRGLAFDLAGDLDAAGARLLEVLLDDLEHAHS